MWARIADGAVAELVDEDPVGRFHPDMQFAEAFDWVEPGMLYDGREFKPRPKPPEPSPAPREVSKQELVQRIQAAGKLRAVRAALNFGVDDQDLTDDELFLRDRWEASGSFRADDGPVREALAAAGCDVDALLGPLP